MGALEIGWARAVALVSLTLTGPMAFAACDRGSGDQGAATTASAPASGAVSGSAAAPSAAPSGSVAAAGSGAADPPTPDTQLAGTWEGSYDAKKGSVVMPQGVKDDNWSKDDGKAAVGAGTISVRVHPDGRAEGEAKGVLGPQVITGKADGNVLRLSVSAKDPLAPKSFHGVLVAELKDHVLRGELHVAGPDANVVRESPVELKRAK